MNDVSFRISQLNNSHKIAQLFQRNYFDCEDSGSDSDKYSSSTTANKTSNQQLSDSAKIEHFLKTSTNSHSPPVKIFNPEAFCNICQKEFCNKYYLATHRATKHPSTIHRSETGAHTAMLQSQLVDFGGMRPDMNGSQNGMDLNQLVLASLDQNSLAPNHPLRSFYLSQLAALSGGSPSPASSAPSSTAPSETPISGTLPTSQTNQPTTDTTPPTSAADLSQMPSWFTGMMPQAQNGLPNGMSSFLEQMGGGLGLLGGNPMNALAAAFAQSGGGIQNTPLTPNSANNILAQGGFNTPQKDAYCSLCDKTFCNRYFLRTHMQKKHGINDESMSPQKAASPHMGAFPFTLPPSTSAGFPQNSVIVNGEIVPKSEETPSSPNEKRSKMEEEQEDEAERNRSALDNLLFASMNTTSCSCDECGKEFSSVFAVMAHKASEHSTMDTSKDSKEMVRCTECDEKFESSDILQQHHLIAHGGMARQLLSGLMPQGFPNMHFLLPGGLPQQFGGLEGMDMSGMQTPKQNSGAVKRQYSSNGKNYCDLCNKEVCNKYFLRTHMLKMHGIVIDENKTVIANIDTLEKEKMGALSFRCDICMREMKSRNLLRQHKQNEHGVQPLSTPQRSSKPQTTPNQNPSPMVNASPLHNSLSDCSEQCPLCLKRVHNLSIHCQQEHSDLPSVLLNQIKAASNIVETIPCKYCPARFKDDLESQLHAISEHAAEILASQSDFKRDEGVEKCTQCQYATRNPRNMELHMERHERINEAKATEEDDEALKITSEVALQMAQRNSVLSQFGVVSRTSPVVMNEAEEEIGEMKEVKENGKMKCEVCSRSYTNQIAFDKHQATVHAHSCKINPRTLKKRTVTRKSVGKCAKNRMRFPCQKCPKRFSTRDECVSHLLTHLNTSKTTKVEDVITMPAHHERNSHTSGSLSPSGDSLPEGFGQTSDGQKHFVMQSFIVREKENNEEAHFPNEVLCHLPVRSFIPGPLSITFDMIPAGNSLHNFNV